MDVVSQYIDNSLRNSLLVVKIMSSVYGMTDKTIVLITGANTGLGLEIVKSLYANFAKHYHIILGARSIDKANEAIASVQQSQASKDSQTTFEAVQIDLESDASISAAYEHIKATHPRIDALVNNGGAAFDNEMTSGRLTAREAWNKAYDVNVSGTQVMTTTFVPLLLESSDPRLIFVTSGLSTLEGARDPNSPRYMVPPAGWPKPAGLSFIAYRSSKTALNMLMIDWDRILKNDGVKVWCISPGLLATGLGGNPEALKKIGAEDPVVGGNFVRDVLEGKRDSDTGKVINRGGVQPW